MIDLWIAPELEFWPNFGTRTWYERSFGPFSGVNLWDEETEKEEQHLSCRQGSQTRFPTGTIKEITQHLSVTRHETPVFPAISVIYSEQFQSSSLWVDFPVGWFFWGALMILDAYLSIIHVCILSLVGGLEHFCFHIYIYILGIASSQLTSCPSFFRGVAQPPTSTPWSDASGHGDVAMEVDGQIWRGTMRYPRFYQKPIFFLRSYAKTQGLWMIWIICYTIIGLYGWHKMHGII